MQMLAYGNLYFCKHSLALWGEVIARPFSHYLLTSWERSRVRRQTPYRNLPQFVAEYTANTRENARGVFTDLPPPIRGGGKR